MTLGSTKQDRFLVILALGEKGKSMFLWLIPQFKLKRE